MAIRRGFVDDPVPDQYQRRLRLPVRQRTPDRRPHVRQPVRFHWIIWLGPAAALIVLLLPVVIVVLAGLTAGEYLTFPPQGLSLRWVVAFLESPTFFPAYLFSLMLALITMAIS